MKVGDYAVRSWPGTPVPPEFGLILSFERRTLEHHTQADIDSNPVRLVTVLQANGKIRKWYAVHTKVISESR